MVMETLEKVFFEKISDTIMWTCNLSFPLTPQHLPAWFNMHGIATRFLCSVLLKLMKTRKLLLLLLAIYLGSDGGNQGKDFYWQLQVSLKDY